MNRMKSCLRLLPRFWRGALCTPGYSSCEWPSKALYTVCQLVTGKWFELWWLAGANSKWQVRSDPCQPRLTQVQSKTIGRTYLTMQNPHKEPHGCWAWRVNLGQRSAYRSDRLGRCRLDVAQVAVTSGGDERSHRERGAI